MCPYEEKLTAWLLGDLSPAEQETLTRHLATCATCRAARDELAAVLAPLQSGLAKDQRLRPPAPRPRHWTASLLHAPWLRAAALFLVSCSAFFLLIGLYYRQVTTTRKEPVGPVTTITFYKGEPPPEVLEQPAPPPAEEADIQPLVFDARVPPARLAEVTAPAVPAHDIYLPHFLTFAQFAMWGSASNTPPVIYNQLIAQQHLPPASTNATTDNIPVLQPTPLINATPPLR